MQKVFKLYFDPRGRVSRKQFWLYFVLGGLVLACVFGSAERTWQHPQHHLILHFEVGLQHFPSWSRILGLSFDQPFASTHAILWLWPPFALSAKRLHDIGWSAWWLMAYVALGVIMQVTAFIGHSNGLMFGPDRSPLPLWYVLGGIGLVGVAAPLVPGLWPGQEGKNRYGPAPTGSPRPDMVRPESAA